MKNLFKKLAISVITACIALTGVFAAACQNNNTDDPAVVGYSITVLYPDGSPVKSTDTGNTRMLVHVILQDGNGNDLTAPEDGELDAYGTANTDFKTPGEYKIIINNVPEGYAYKDVVTTTADKAKYTITLENNKIAYEISVVKPDGTPFAGKSVKLLNGSTEAASLTTDAQGKATSAEIAADNYNVVVDIPKEYGYRPVTTSKSASAATVKLFDVHKIEFGKDDVASPEVMESWAAERNSPALNYFPVNTAVDNYLYTADIKEGETEYFFRIRAPWTGKYTVNCRSDKGEDGSKLSESNYTFLFYRDNFGTPDENWTLSGSQNSGNNTQYLSLNEGDEYIVSVRSNNGKPYKMDFLMSFDRQPAEITASAAGEFTLTYDEINYALLKFTPTKSGMYEISSLDAALDPEIISISAATNNPLPGEYPSDVFGYEVLGAHANGADGNFVFTEEVGESYTGNTYIYRIGLKGAVSYPAELKVKIERTGDASAEEQYQTVKVAPSATLVQQTKPEGSWTWLDGDSQLPVEKDGGWYVGDKQVFVAITKNLKDAEYSFATIEYMGDGNVGPGGEGGSQQTQQNNYLSVKVVSELKIYNYTDFIKAYSEKCTQDGCYALNGELKTFLERYLAIHWTDLVISPDLQNPPANPWLIGCGYYA